MSGVTLCHPAASLDPPHFWASGLVSAVSLTTLHPVWNNQPPAAPCVPYTLHASPWSWPVLKRVSSFLYKLNVCRTTCPVLLLNTASWKTGQKGLIGCGPVCVQASHTWNFQRGAWTRGSGHSGRHPALPEPNTHSQTLPGSCLSGARGRGCREKEGRLSRCSPQAKEKYSS